MSAGLRIKHVLADKLVFSKIKAALGGRLKYMVYGAAPLASEIEEFFAAMGIRILGAYGLTETSSTIALLGPEDHRAAFQSDDPAVRQRLGSVGQPLPTVELEIRDGQRVARDRK